eukprot:1368062-Amphidinium_carterae.1
MAATIAAGIGALQQASSANAASACRKGQHWVQAELSNACSNTTLASDKKQHLRKFANKTNQSWAPEATNANQIQSNVTVWSATTISRSGVHITYFTQSSAIWGGRVAHSTFSISFDRRSSPAGSSKESADDKHLLLQHLPLFLDLSTI